MESILTAKQIEKITNKHLDTAQCFVKQQHTGALAIIWGKHYARSEHVWMGEIVPQGDGTMMLTFDDEYTNCPIRPAFYPQTTAGLEAALAVAVQQIADFWEKA